MLFHQANNESEELQKELSSLERQAECQRNLDSSMAELLKVFESKAFQDNFQGMTLDSVVVYNRRKRNPRHLIMIKHQLSFTLLLFFTNSYLACLSCSFTSILLALTDFYFI